MRSTPFRGIREITTSISSNTQANDAFEESTIVREFPAVAASVRAAREAVADLARRFGADERCVDDVRLAVSEAATNVVMHAYERETEGTFRLMAVVGENELLVVVEDDGRGLTSPARTPGLGAGLRVMRETAEQALFRERERGGSSVQLRFELAPPQ